MDESEIVRTIGQYKFYHIIKLTDNISTAGCTQYVPFQNLCLKHLASLDLRGKDVLDIGCRDGLFSFKAESMGASRVIGIDNDLSEPATQFLIPFFNSAVRMEQLNLYDLKPDTFGLFDIVIFPGVLYHLRYPFWGLKLIRDVMRVGGHLLIETPIWHGEVDKAILFCPTGNEGPYESDPTSCTFFNEKGLKDTVISLGFEMVSVEYLNKSLNIGERSSVPHKFRQLVKSALQRKGTAQSSLTTDRCVFHLIYRGYDEESFLAKYWESRHDFHTLNG